MNMRVFLRLVQLSTTFRTLGQRTRKVPAALYYLLLIAAFIPAEVSLFVSFRGLYLALNTVHGESVELAAAVVIAQAFSFLAGVVLTNVYAERLHADGCHHVYGPVPRAVAQRFLRPVRLTGIRGEGEVPDHDHPVHARTVQDRL